MNLQNKSFISERYRRYKIIREHGLLVPSKTLSWYAQYVDAFESVEKIKAHKKINGTILSFVQLTSPVNFDKLLEGMQHFSELKSYILKYVFFCKIRTK